MIKHIVFWNFEDSAIQKEAIDRLETLPALITEIIDFEVGVDFNRSEPAFEVALYTSFASKEALGIYQKHPKHIEVAQFIGAHATQRAVVDYEIDGDE